MAVYKFEKCIYNVGKTLVIKITSFKNHEKNVLIDT